jgi:hypothetical protein
MGITFEGEEPSSPLQTTPSTFSQAWPSLPESANVEDRTDWNLLGYSDSGDAYSQAADGTVYAQPFTGYPPDANHPNGLATWGDPQNQGVSQQMDPGANGKLHTDDPTVDSQGHAKFKKCPTCSPSASPPAPAPAPGAPGS